MVNITEYNFSERIPTVTNIWVERILINLSVVVRIDETIYVKYIGPEDKYEAFQAAYRKYKPEIDLFFAVDGVKIIRSSEKLNEDKLSWLKQLIIDFEAKNISFSIL